MENERALLRCAKGYDRVALGQLYDHYAPRIYAYVYRRVGDARLAEDLVGDTFVRVIQAIRAQCFWHSSFQAWLYRIAHNLVVDHYRRQPSQAALPLDTMPQDLDQHNAIDDAIEAAHARQRLEAAIGQLTPEQQHVLVLRFGQGLTAREAAQALNKTTCAVEALQRRALASLHRILTNTGSPRHSQAAKAHT